MDKHLTAGQHQRSRVPHIDTPRPTIIPTSRINIKWHPENRLRRWGPNSHKRHVTKSETGTLGEGEKSSATVKEGGVWTPHNPESACPKPVALESFRILRSPIKALSKETNKAESEKMQLKEDNLKAHDGEKSDLRDTDSDEESSSSKRSREEMEEGMINEEDAKAHGGSKKSRLDSGDVITKQEGGDTPEKQIHPKGRNMNAPVQYKLEHLRKDTKATLSVEQKKKESKDTGSEKVGSIGCEGDRAQIFSEKVTCKDVSSKKVKGKKKTSDIDSTEDSDEDKEDWTKVVQRLTDEVNELEPVQSLSSQLQRTSPPLMMNEQYEHVHPLRRQLQGTNHPTGQPVFMHPWGLFPFGSLESGYPVDPRYQVWPQHQYLPNPYQVRHPCPPRPPHGIHLPSTSQGQVPTRYSTPPYSKLDKTPVSSTGASGGGTIDSTPGYCRYTPPGETGFVAPHEGFHQPVTYRKMNAGDGQFEPTYPDHLRGHVPERTHIYFESSDDDDGKDKDAEKQTQDSSAKEREADGIKTENEEKVRDEDSFTPTRPKRKIFIPGKIKQMMEGRCNLSRIQAAEESKGQSFIGLIKKETSVSIYSQQQLQQQNNSSSSHENIKETKSDQDGEKVQRKQEFISFQQAWSEKHGLHKDEPRSQRIARIQPRRRLTLQEEVMMESIPKELHNQFNLPSPSFSLPPNCLPSLRSDVIYPWSKEEYIDTHCHIDFLYQRLGCHGTFDKFGRVRNFPDNYGGCVAVFCTPESFHPSNELWKNLLNEDKIWGAFGCHPHHVKNYDGVVETHILEGMMHSKAIAFGEIGLDYSNRNTSDHILQHMVFKRQLALALQLQKPLVIHSRDAESDTLDIMVSMVPKDYKIHRHCFTGPPEEARTFLKAFPNSFIGITNLVTFPSAVETHRTAQVIPLDKILLETDAPYFLPRQCPREIRWSHPAMAVFVAEKIARLKGITTDEVLRAVRKNTREMYGI